MRTGRLSTGAQRGWTARLRFWCMLLQLLLFFSPQCALFSELQATARLRIEDTLPNGIGRVSPTVNHCFAHGTWSQASDRRQTPRPITAYFHCLSLLRDEWPHLNKFLPALPRPPAGSPASEALPRKREATDRANLRRDTAPVLDPTSGSNSGERQLGDLLFPGNINLVLLNSCKSRQFSAARSSHDQARLKNNSPRRPPRVFQPVQQQSRGSDAHIQSWLRYGSKGRLQ
jgi:hypothetical protein